MGQRDDTDTAAARLHELHRYFREHPVRGAEGHSYTAGRARTPASTSPVPYDTAVVEHITASVAEVAAHTRKVNPDAGQLPAHVADVYAWARANIQHAPAIEQQHQAVIEARQGLEHAIAAGDHKVVRPHRCPACHTLGVHWPEGVRDPKARAMCLNVHCANANNGTHRRWSLARLAYEHVTFEKTLRDCAT